MIVADPALLDNLLIAANEIGLHQEQILIFDNHDERLPNGFQSWRTLFKHGEIDWPRFESLEEQRDTTIALLYSSGTTGGRLHEFQWSFCKC